MFYSLDFEFPTHVRRYTFTETSLSNSNSNGYDLNLIAVQHEDSIEHPHLKDCPRIVEYCSVEILHANFDKELEVFILDPPFGGCSILIESPNIRFLIPPNKIA